MAGFGGMGGMGRGFMAFDPSGPGSIFALALKIVMHAEENHNEAVSMATAVREAIVSMAVAMALVTHAQNKERPIIALGVDELDNLEGHNPAEMLESLIPGWSSMEDYWDETVSKFMEIYNSTMADKVIKEMPKEVFVSDILGEEKKD